MALLTPEECEVDACVLGTGLTESIVAAAFARLGRKVLHLDREESYGGCWRALGLAELQDWAGGACEDDEAQLAGGDFRSLTPEGWHRLHARFSPPGLAMPSSTAACSGFGFQPKARRQEEAEPPPVPLPAEATSGGLTAVALETGSLESCYLDRSFDWDPFRKWDRSALKDKKAELLRSPNAFSLDLVPRLLFGRSEAVDVLVESGVARYLEFQGLKSARVLTSQGLASVPLTKSDIFQDPHLSLPEKRMLMRFVTSMTPFVGSLAFQSAAQLGVDQARKVKGPSELESDVLEGVDLQEPWQCFLERQKLSKRLQEFITYAICLWDWAPKSGASHCSAWPELSCAEGLQRMGRFVSSLGMYGRGTGMPLLYPMYGVAEMAQGFTRMCALHRGVYALRTYATHVLVSKGEGEVGGDGNTASSSCKVAGVVTQRGEVIRASSVISSCDHILQEGGDGVGQKAPRASCRRITVLLDCTLLAEEGVNLCVVPPGSFEPPLGNVVQVLQLDWSTGSCPRGYFVAHLSQAWIGEDSAGQDMFGDLDRVLDGLLSHCGGPGHCIFRCRYLHKPRPSQRWDLASEGGEALQACSQQQGLAIVADPAAVPQLLAADEVSEAKRLFLAAPAEGKAPSPEDFLRKPTHVAEEERGNAMEELEYFNEQMQEAEKGPLPTPVLQAAEQAVQGDMPPEAADAATSETRD